MRGVLVIGYGNPLRGDDALGWHAAGRLAEDPRLDGIEVLWRHQLTPELALDISDASLVVLVDARDGDEPGVIRVERVVPADVASTAAWSHHVEPVSLMTMARDLYGGSPDVFTVSVGTASLELGDPLSPAVKEALPGVVEAVLAIVAAHGPERAGRPSV